MREHIQYDFLFDNHFQELKDAELNNNRVDLAIKMEPYLGRYYSAEYIKKQVLQQTDSERKEIELRSRKNVLLVLFHRSFLSMLPSPRINQILEAEALAI